jgi:DNA-directed RNA polymerase subunit beta
LLSIGGYSLVAGGKAEVMQTRRYGKCGRELPIPDLTETQRKFYAEFLQADCLPDERKNQGLEAIFRESFPITSYDGSMSLDYVCYEIGEPRHNPDECRALGLSYAAPLKIRLRLNGKESIEEDVYLGQIPLMLGGGEFVVNGSERVIVTQIQRSPGVDFSETIHSSGKRLFSCRIIPERGSWLQAEVTSRDVLTIRIDRSSRIPATCLMRALDRKFSTDADILGAFYPIERVSLTERGFRDKLKGAFLCTDVVEPSTGEVLAESRSRVTDEVVNRLVEAEVPVLDVVRPGRDELLLNTLAGDESRSHEDAVLRIYMRLRPGTPPNTERAVSLINDLFFNDKRFNFGRIGRFRLNRKFGTDIPETHLTLTGDDILHVIRYIMMMRVGKGELDDIDHLENRRIRTIGDLVSDEFRRGMLKLRRAVRERMSLKDAEDLTPRTLVNSQAVAASVEYFFARGELSQVVDQSNPLSQLTHERRLSALGPGGLNRKRAGFEVRDVHPSHYGRICPIETPEGGNIGLIVSMGVYASVNEYGFLVTPYHLVKNGKIVSDLLYLRADEESKYRIAQANIPHDESGRITVEKALVRHQEDFVLVDVKDVELVDVSPMQMVGVAASLIPFLEHDDANRALMGSNMQRQAVPLLCNEPPLVGTGMEPAIARNSGMMVVADKDGTVEYVDSLRIVIGGTEYPLRKYFGLNDRTCLNQKPIVRVGDRVAKGQVLTEGAATIGGELALGRNVLVAFMSWEGYNFEDAIVVSERLLKTDAFTSIHIQESATEVRETKLGREEITRDIPNVPESQLRNLDSDGLIRVGTRVRPGDILVGKIAPKSKSELSSEEKLLHAIFGRAGEDIKNDSLDVKPGSEGYVIDVQRFMRRNPASEDRELKRDIKKIEDGFDARIMDALTAKYKALVEVVGGRLINVETKRVMGPAPGANLEAALDADAQLNLNKLDVHPASRRKAKLVAVEHDRIRRLIEIEKDRTVGRLKRGDELPAGVLELVKVSVAMKRKLMVGDKMAGRHGNKGVVSVILREEDMPFLADGTPVDMILNPLGVPSRMNFGQILETHLGWAAQKLGFRAVSPIFDGATHDDIRKALKEAGLPEDGKVVLLDGRTGEAFDQKVTVGCMYILKLHHLVADKIHARATGPYSLITQQPLGGKARNGGQRFGEMEVWALEAYGAANILQEILTVKSDDVEGRTKVYESMVKGENALDAGMPVAFEVLMNEIRGLGLNMKLERRQADLPMPALPASAASVPAAAGKV